MTSNLVLRRSTLVELANVAPIALGDVRLFGETPRAEMGDVSPPRGLGPTKTMRGLNVGHPENLQWGDRVIIKVKSNRTASTVA